MTNFIPAGFQYYRAPTPKRECWDSDLKKLKADGYNVVKYWLQWRWNEPEEGKFYFDDIDELMDLAHKHDLKVVLNLILDVSPVWLSEKYADSGMISARGEKIEGFATEYRQIGGVPGPCLHHEGATALRMRFVEKCAERYRSHPALYIWDVWNEPELTAGIKRQPHVDDLVCYCPHSLKAFRAWLKEKYGKIQVLNECWGRNYLSFDYAEPSKRHGTVQDMVDWRLFFVDSITQDFLLRYGAVKKWDDAHSIMCHTVPLPLFNSISCCSNDFDIAKGADLVGNSVGSNPLAADILKSCAKGKTILNSEVHAAYGNTGNGCRVPTMNDMLKHIFIPLAHGSRGFMFWQYRPETLGLEAPCWGNVTLKGEDTNHNLYYKQINAFMKEHATEICASKPPKGEVGIYLDAANEIYTWNTFMDTEVFTSSVTGCYNLFYRNNYEIEFFNKESVEKREIFDYRAIYFPATFYFDSKLMEKLADYVKEGGTAIVEVGFGMVDGHTGYHADELPGCGFASTFKIRQTELYSTKMMDNSYDNKLHAVGKSERIECLYKGESCYGGRFFARYEGERASEVVATTTDGDPVATVISYGKGRVVLLSTLLAYGYDKYGGEAALSLLADIVGAPKASYRKEVPAGVRVDVVGDCFAVVDNTTDQVQEFTLPFCGEASFGDISVEKNKITLQKNKVGVIKIVHDKY